LKPTSEFESSVGEVEGTAFEVEPPVGEVEGVALEVEPPDYIAYINYRPKRPFLASAM